MVNKSRKGTNIELKAIKILESMGYTIHRAVRTHVKRGNMFISQSNDVYGCIDLIAKKPGHKTRWVQVTTRSVSIGTKMKDLGEIPWNPEHDEVEVWQFWSITDNKDGTGAYFQLRDYFKGGELVKEDTHRYYLKDFVKDEN